MVERAQRALRAPSDRVFFPLAALTVIIFVVFGFAPTYYFKAFTSAPELRPSLHLHGLLFSAWLALFLGQTLLIRSGNVSIHRRMGAVGATLAVLMLVVGTIVAFEGAARSPAADWVLAITFGDLIMFAAFVGLAIHYRARSAIHKRLMFLATVAIIDAGTGRWPFVTAMFQNDPRSTMGTISMWALTDLLIVAGMIYDRVVHKRVHAAYVWGGLALVVSQAARLAVIDTESWQALTAVLVQLAQ